VSETTLGLVVLFGLGLTSVAIRNIAKKSGRDLFFYVGALVLVGALGALIAHQSDAYSCAIGLVMGMAAVELGATMLASSKDVIRKGLSKVSDKFADDRQPGYSADTDEEPPANA
jgi:hypothetical protein